MSPRAVPPRVDLWFDDFKVGERFESRGCTLTESDIIDFAFRYDPQPFHIDREAAARSHFGGVIASGIHTLAVSWRLILQTGFLGEANLGGPGMDELRWVKPVHAGDTLRVAAEVVEARASRSKPDRGAVRLALTTRNQRQETVMTAALSVVVKRRP
jgi:acyl dehydratase